MENRSFDFERCEDEPIHIPGMIQPLGYFLAIDEKQIICYTSENIDQLNFQNKKTLTLSLDIFSKKLYQIYEKFQSLEKENIRKLYTDIVLENQNLYDIFISQKDSFTIIEILPRHNTTKSIEIDYISSIQNISASKNIKTLFDNVVNCIEKITKYDRVMLYKFDENYNGKVVAEKKLKDLDSYLDLHYPASDIPPQARDLYLKNPIRIITDVEYTPINILSNSSQTIDMSLSFLRSVSPIHLQYMKNMGVFASMTISIIIDNKLWGLIACHHKTPHFPQVQTTYLCEKISFVVSSLINIFEKQEFEKSRGKFLATIDTILSIFKSNLLQEELIQFMEKNLLTFLPLFEANGIIIKKEKTVISQNINLPQKSLNLLIQKIESLGADTFYTTSLADHFALEDPILKACAGVVLINIKEFDTLFIFTKTEQVETIEWGGDPTKKIENLNPRISFEKFSQIVTKRSLPWARDIKQRIEIVQNKFIEIFHWQYSQHTIQTQKNKINTLEEEKSTNQAQLIDMLISMIEQRDSYTAGHTQRVANFCVLIAKELGLSTYDIDLVNQAAKLHDVGKVSIPDSILLKPARLSQQEYLLIKRHLDVGYDILSKIGYYKEVADIMCHHHEKYDGSGYPFGKKGDEIPILGHIMIVADALDAMTTNRIYQSRKTIEEAIEEIQSLSGTWYHPIVVDALLKLDQDQLNFNADTSQLPLTQIEHERFSYFFKDPLTSLFNESYLWMILNGSIPNTQINHFVLIEIRGMTKYNKIHGWKTGSVLISSIAKYIQKHYDSIDIFRVFGDDFILGFESKESKETFLNLWQEVKIAGVHTVIKDIKPSELVSKMQILI